jgi:hypothetical protein
MALVLGIDPGTSGAFALYSTDTRSVVGEIIDTPVWYQTVGKKKRKRVDAVGITEMFDTYTLMGVDLIVMEAVGGRRAQNAAHAFTFGYGVGIVYMAAFYSGIVMDTVPPQTWKQYLNVPGKSKADDSAILARAEELFPDAREQFRTKRGGKRIDRAEAAMIAKFGGDFIYDKTDPARDIEYASVYRHMDTGA